MTTQELYMIELSEWTKTINFYQGEIGIFEERLTEVAQKNTRPSITGSIEHFQNQFIIQRDALQALGRDVHRQQDKIVLQVKEGDIISDMDIVDEQFMLRDRVHISEKILLELKHSFYRFLANVL